MRACSKTVASLLLSLIPLVASAQGPAYLKWRMDDGNTGWNSRESTLTPSNVRPATFGKLSERPVTGQIYAQPLYVPGVEVPGVGVRNLVYVATQANFVYAFDADSHEGAGAHPIWVQQLGVPVPSERVNCFDTVPTIGITSTPVIDLASNTMFVVAKTLESDRQFWRIFAIDIRTGARLSGWGIPVSATVPGTNGDAVGGRLSFNPVIQNQRTGLVLVNGRLVFTFSAHCGNNYHRIHGWVYSFNASDPTEAPKVICTTPNLPLPGVSGQAGGGIWMSGSAPVVYDGNVFVISSNGPMDYDLGGPNVGNSFLRLDLLNANGRAAIVDYFSPSNQEQLVGNVDLGAGGPMLFPPQPGANKRMLAGGGKSGRIYILNPDDLGGFNGRSDQGAPNDSIQELQFGNGFWSSPGYLGSAAGNLMLANAVGERVYGFRVQIDSRGNPSMVFQGESPGTTGYPSSTLVSSSNGSDPATGLVWYLNRASNALHALNGADLSQEVYNSNMAFERDSLGRVMKFTVPTVANGRVFVGTDDALVIYGLGPPRRGVLNEFGIAGPESVALGARASFLILARDAESAPAMITGNYTVDLQPPRGAITRLGTLNFLRQSSFLFTRAYTVAGRHRLIIDRGGPFERVREIVVRLPRPSGLDRLNVVTTPRVALGARNRITINALNAAGSPIALTARVTLRAALSDGSVRSIGSIRFSNQTSAVLDVALPEPGMAVILANFAGESGSAPTEVLPAPIMTGLVHLSHWGGSTRPQVRAVLYRPNTTNITRRYSIPIQDDFTFTVNIPPGTYDVLVKVGHWLAQRRRFVYLPQVHRVLFNGQAGFGMINGDTNDDNVINVVDLNNVNADLGRAPSGNFGSTDLNGDGIVNASDAQIVNQNLGLAGDN